MSNAQDYAAKIDIISAIANKDMKFPSMPVDVYVQEAEDLFSVVADNKEKFEAIGFDVSSIDDLSVRIGACREAESLWQALFNTNEEAQKLWLDESPGAYFMRDDLLDVMRYAFRKDVSLLSNVKNIAKGRGHADMIQDLNDIAALGRDNKEFFDAINFDAVNFSKAADLADRMGTVLGDAHKEEGINKARIIRDKAYTYLKELVDEVKETGKFIFRYDPVMLDKLNSDFFKKMNRPKKDEDDFNNEDPSEETTE